ncbi:DNA-binding Xre family transcriptional regulator [Alkalibaculum bacchi]|uniref:DNA-binding Xre family transcriptional regulator n=1 Tax=Alkalibaculum bacchi TaxID=645887 RepID=A0A366I2D5_9FIRM|nr:helix-turn-helix transcriptional regulator [Alkalibaculum bacchi]RBP60388.1 DNA-binding Xre family transcriptional regulator [Alkalibaculum bacchi]
MSSQSCFSYKKLFKKLIDEDMSNKDLMDKADISRSTFYKIKNSENVTTETLLRICEVFDCDISEIMERVKNIDDIEEVSNI